MKNPIRIERATEKLCQIIADHDDQKLTLELSAVLCILNNRDGIQMARNIDNLEAVIREGA